MSAAVADEGVACDVDGVEGFHEDGGWEALDSYHGSRGGTLFVVAVVVTSGVVLIGGCCLSLLLLRL